MIGRRHSANLLAAAHRAASRPFTSRAPRVPSRTVPEWLQSVTNDRSDAPKLYAWSLSNIEGSSTLANRFGPGALNEAHDQQSDSHRRIYVIGPGNLGVLFASSLVSMENPPPITLVFHRQDLLSSWGQRPGIEISRDGVPHKYSNFDVELWSEEPPTIGRVREIADGRSIRNLIVTTKASQALPEVDRIRRYLDGNSSVAFAQNGMCKMWPPHGTTYTSSRYSDDYPHPNWLACVTTHGVTSLGRFRSVHASMADVKVGPVLVNQDAPTSNSFLSDMITQAPHLNGTAVARDHLWILQLEKLVVNSIINPLTAILHCKNGQLFIGGHVLVERLMDRLLQEASKVLQTLVNDSSADSILQNPGSTEKDVSRDALLERFSQVRLRRMLYDVGHKVRENTSSMLQDVRAGKETEINEFNGWIVEMASYLEGDLDVTSHKTLIDLVKKGVVLDATSLSKHFAL